MSTVKKENFIEHTNGKDINLKEYYEVIKKRFWIIMVVTILSTVAGYFYSNHNNIPLYQTSTRIIIGADSEHMKTLMVMIKDPIIMEKVKNELHLSQSAEGIASQIVVEQIDASQVIRISVTNANPKLAVRLANETAKAFKSEIVSILNFKDVQLLSPAKENPYPINGDQNRTVVIAFVFGIIIGIGLVFLIDSLDETIKRDSEVEGILGVPVIGVISNMNKKKLLVKKSVKNRIEFRGETIGIK